MIFKLSALKACAAALGLSASVLATTPAAAVPVQFAGDLTGGALNTQITGLDTYDYLTPALWSVGNFWTLSVIAGDIVTVTIRRISNIDPYLAIWNGIEADTDDFPLPYLSTSTTTLIATGDDELAAAVSGSAGWGDPQATFTAATTGTYMVAAIGLGGDNSQSHGYTIQAIGSTAVPVSAASSALISVVPLPATLPLLAFGLGIAGWVGRRARKPV